MSLTGRWITSVEIVLYQEATAFRICNEGVILALVPLLFWGWMHSCSEFFTVSSCSLLLSSQLFWFWKKACISAFDVAFWRRLYSAETLFENICCALVSSQVGVTLLKRQRQALSRRWRAEDRSPPPRQRGAAAAGMQDSASDSKMAKQVSMALIALMAYCWKPQTSQWLCKVKIQEIVAFSL